MKLTLLNAKQFLQSLLLLCAAFAASACGQNAGDRISKEEEVWREYYTQAMLLRHESDHSPAEVLAGLHKAADYAQKKLGPESFSYVTTARSLAKQYELIGDFEKSESLLLETYQIGKENNNHNAGEYYTQDLQDLIKFYGRRGDLEKKQKYIDEMKQILAPYLEESKDLEGRRKELKERQLGRGTSAEE